MVTSADKLRLTQNLVVQTLATPKDWWQMRIEDHPFSILNLLDETIKPKLKYQAWILQNS